MLNNKLSVTLQVIYRDKKTIGGGEILPPTYLYIMKKTNLKLYLMKKTCFLYGAAALLMAGCANDDFSGENVAKLDGTMPIAFNMQGVPGSRAETTTSGKSAANALGNEFIVWGEKTNNSTVSTVFENYRVQYQGTSNDENSGSSSVSNTNGWEYVGITPYAKVNNVDVVSPNILTNGDDTKQTIKYWDTATGTTYNFTAVSALQSDLTAGNVKITRTPTSSTDNSAEGYTIKLSKGAKAENIYVADKQPSISPKNPTTVKDIQPVTMQFRNFQSKIRFGFYETVEGYKVQITGVKYNNASTSKSDKFGVDGQFVQVPTGSEESDVITYTVTYDSKNKPVLKMGELPTSSKVTYKEFGTNVFNKNLGEVSTSPVYDKTGTDLYTAILPNTGNETNMSFTVDYKLISDDTGEVIEVANKNVTVPAQFCQWKPNYAYTYLFKVTDQSAELFPITFDAVVVSDQTGNQETITEVGKPSITTYATVSSTDNTVVTDKDEYESGNVIYATVSDTEGMTSNNTALFTVTASGAVAPAITEAAVANCFTNGVQSQEGTSPKTYTATDANGGVLTLTAATTEFANTVPNENGVGTRSINALKWTAANDNTESSAYYAIQYKKTADGADTYYYKIVKIAKKAN